MDTPRPPAVAGPAGARPRLAVALTFPVTPPRGGGQSRVFHLYRELALSFDVTLVCLAGPDEVFARQEIAPGLVEVRVPRSEEHQRAEMAISDQLQGTPVTDIVAADLLHLSPRYLEALDEACTGAVAGVASHPYLVRPLLERHPALPLWFEAHNMEWALKRDILPPTEAGQAWLARVDADERLAWRRAHFVMACTAADIEALRERHGDNQALLLEVPNGFADDEVRRVEPAVRAELKRQLGLDERPLALFVGSWHGPNLQALDRIFGYAAVLPDFSFLAVGSACLYYQSRERPENLRLAGVVDGDELQLMLSVADFALNPMTTGSGSNLKMLDYFAAGIPVLSTRFGARGLGVRPGEHYLEAEVDAFPLQLLHQRVLERPLLPMVDRAERHVRQRHGWRAIGSQATQFILQQVLPARPAASARSHLKMVTP